MRAVLRTPEKPLRPELPMRSNLEITYIRLDSGGRRGSCPMVAIPRLVGLIGRWPVVIVKSYLFGS